MTAAAMTNRTARKSGTGMVATTSLMSTKVLPQAAVTATRPNAAAVAVRRGSCGGTGGPSGRTTGSVTRSDHRQRDRRGGRHPLTGRRVLRADAAEEPAQDLPYLDREAERPQGLRRLPDLLADHARHGDQARPLGDDEPHGAPAEAGAGRRRLADHVA